MQIKARWQAFSVVLIYLIATGGWFMSSDALLKRLVSNPDERTDFSVVKGWVFMLVTGGLLYLVLRRLLNQREREAEKRIQAEIARQEIVDELQRSDEQLRLILEASADGLWDWNLKTGIADLSPRCWEICGYAAGEATANLDFLKKLVHPEDWPGVLAALNEHLAGKSSQNVSEYRMITQDGTEKWIWNRGKVVARAADGSPLRMVGTLSDITLRKRAQAELRENEAKFRAIFNINALAIAIIEPDSTISMVNDACCQSSGYTRQDMVGKSWKQHVPSEDLERITEYNRRRLINPQDAPEQYEFRFFNKKGEVRHGQMAVALIQNSGQIIASILDITERKLAEEALRASEERYRQLFDLESDAIILVDCETHRFVDVNQSAQRFYGYDREEFLQMTVEGVSDEPEKTHVLAETGNAFVPLRWHRKKNGEWFAVEITANLIQYKGRRTELAAVRDITDRQQVMEKLEETAGQLLEAQHIARLGSYNINVKTGIWTSSVVLDELFGIADSSLTKDMTGWLQIVHPEERAEMRRYLNDEVLQGHAPFDRAYRIVRMNDQQERWVHGLGKLILDDHGQVMRMMGVIQDVTEHKLAEQALQESQALYQSLVMQLPAGIFRKDHQGRYVFVNAEYCRLKKIPAEDFLGKTPLEVMAAQPAGKDVPELIRKYAAAGEDHHEQIMRTGKTIELDEEYLLADGERQFVHVMKLPVWNTDGKIVGTQGLMFDITERKHTEEQVHLQSTALTAAANAIIITDHQGKIAWVNPAFTRLTGYSAEEAIGANPRVLKSGQHPPAFYANLWATITTGNVWHGEVVNKRKDGQFYTEEMTITPVRGADGQIAHFVAVKQDVSERRRLETRLQQAQKMEAIGTLAGGIAHDFNNILAAMFGFGSLLQQDTEGNSAAQASIAEILKAAGRAKDLVQQILTFSRQREQKRLVIRLDTVIKEALKFLRASLPADIKIEMHLDSDSPAVLVDPTQIYQVAINLATNALHAMDGRSGQLTVSLEAFKPDKNFILAHPELKPVQYARLTFTDTGHGMDARVLAHIYEPIFTTKPVGKGTGLGLAVVHGIVQSHDGVITVESTVGKGTTFSLYFPGKTPAAISAGAVNGNFANGQSQKILLLDDEPALTEVFQSLLLRLNYQVTASNSPGEAVGLCRKNPAQFDLVITDLTMPEMNGLEVARQIHAIRPDLPVILTSGFSAALDRKTLRAAGISELLEKPVSLTVLADVMRRTLARS